MIRIYVMGDVVNRKMLAIYDIWLHSVNILVLGEFLSNRQHLPRRCCRFMIYWFIFPHCIPRPPTWLLSHRDIDGGESHPRYRVVIDKSI